jgi:hypothetical protein
MLDLRTERALVALLFVVMLGLGFLAGARSVHEDCACVCGGRS